MMNSKDDYRHLSDEELIALAEKALNDDDDDKKMIQRKNHNKWHKDVVRGEKVGNFAVGAGLAGAAIIADPVLVAVAVGSAAVYLAAQGKERRHEQISKAGDILISAGDEIKGFLLRQRRNDNNHNDKQKNCDPIRWTQEEEEKRPPLLSKLIYPPTDFSNDTGKGITI